MSMPPEMMMMDDCHALDGYLMPRYRSTMRDIAEEERLPMLAVQASAIGEAAKIIVFR